MNLLIILGNALVDYRFRALLFKDPQGTVEAYGLRLTKFEVGMLQAALAGDQNVLAHCFKELEDQLYANLDRQTVSVTPMTIRSGAVPGVVQGCRQRPCDWSLSVPPDLEDAIKKVA